jgi:hypothetical protein
VKAATSLVVFARALERGKVKTRLAAHLGEAAALALYRAFLDDTCALAAGAAERRVLAVAGALDDPELAALARRHRMELVAQAEGDLGARLDRALSSELERAERVCVIGSDAPTLPAAHLDEAFGRLASCEVALGPATDGGYWLIGATRPEPSLFSEIAWGTPAVLPQTLERLAGRQVALLPFHYDLDEPSDLALACAHLRHLPFSTAPETRRALAALGLL